MGAATVPRSSRQAFSASSNVSCSGRRSSRGYLLSRIGPRGGVDGDGGVDEDGGSDDDGSGLLSMSVRLPPASSLISFWHKATRVAEPKHIF